MKTTQSSPVQRVRDWRIDFCRGIALWIIFSDHVHGNFLSEFTPLNLGLSDMAEVFVLLSGYVGGIAYQERIRTAGFASASRHALVRAGQIYLAYAVTTVFLFRPHPPVISLWLTTPRQFGVPPGIMLEQMSDRFVDALCLRTPSNLAILISYVCFVTLLPAITLLATRFPLKTLAGSVALYASVQLFPDTFSLPASFAEVCYFNPLAWQLIFVSGVLVGTQSCADWSWLQHPRSLAAAALILLAGLLLRLMVVETAIPWIDKPNLEPGRLIHFSAVVAIGTHLVFARPVRKHWSLWPLIQCGRHSLPVFCSSVVLSTLATEVLARGVDWIAVQIYINVFGWSVLTGIARFRSNMTTIQSHLRDRMAQSSRCRDQSSGRT